MDILAFDFFWAQGLFSPRAAQHSTALILFGFLDLTVKHGVFGVLARCCSSLLLFIHGLDLKSDFELLDLFIFGLDWNKIGNLH